MPTARIPQPRYISFSNIVPFLIQQINIGIGEGTISLDTINILIAQSESEVEQDLETWYFVPFQTTTGLNWDQLSDTSFDYLYKLFVSRSNYNVYRSYFGTTGENKGDDFWLSELSSYNEMLKRFYKLDQTLNYLYPALSDLKLNPIGMKRILRPSRNGILGGQGAWIAQHAIRRSNDPYLNWG